MTSPIRGPRRTCLWRPCVVFAVLMVLGSRMSHACVGTACIQIWSTAANGGTLAIFWDFSEKIQTFQSFCAPDNSLCLYSAIDPGFMAPPDDPPPEGLFRIADGVSVRIEIVHADAGLAVNVNGQKLSQPGESALLGTMPRIHSHPSWQLVVGGTQFGDYSLMYKLTTTAAGYSDSETYSQIVTNVPPAEETPTPTPTPVPPPPACPGDCDNSTEVTIDELVTCVNLALGSPGLVACAACDANGDGEVAIDDLIASVNAGLNACPTPVPATLDEIQRTIFTPSCAIHSCHDAQSATANLVLTDGMSFGQLVGVAPDVGSSRVDLQACKLEYSIVSPK